MKDKKELKKINKYKKLLKNIKLKETSIEEFLKREGDKFPPDG